LSDIDRSVLGQMDVGALFHSVLFAHQKALKGILGERITTIITGATLPTIEKVLGKASSRIVRAERTEDALKRFADLLLVSELISGANIRKEGSGYLMEIDGCAFAEHVHHMLNPKDVTCPWAIIAMSIAQKASGQGVKMSLSEFTPKGSKTLIELVS